jgi:hypothetical protein
MRRILRSADGQSGLVFVAFGAVVAIVALQYPVGVPGKMGPGFFPLWLGILLVIAGGVVILQALRAEQVALPPVQWRAVACIALAIAVSGLLLLTAGLFVAIPALVAIASFAGRNVSLVRIVVTAITLTALAYLIFILGLDLRIPLTWR